MFNLKLRFIYDIYAVVAGFSFLTYLLSIINRYTDNICTQTIANFTLMYIYYLLLITKRRKA